MSRHRCRPEHPTPQGIGAVAAFERDDRAATFGRAPRCLPDDKGNKTRRAVQARGGIPRHWSTSCAPRTCGAAGEPRGTRSCARLRAGRRSGRVTGDLLPSSEVNSRAPSPATPARALCEAEREQILDVLAGPRFVDRAPAEVVATRRRITARSGRCIGSSPTFPATAGGHGAEPAVLGHLLGPTKCTSTSIDIFPGWSARGVACGRR